MRKLYHSISALLILTIACGVSSAFTVDPSYVVVSGIKPGVKTEMTAGAGKKYFLEIKNDGNATASFKLVFQTCREYGCKPRAGSADIPDIRWISAAERTIAVKPGESSQIRNVRVTVPNVEKFFSKSYQVIVKVIHEASNGKPVNLEVVLPVWINTTAK